jgi:hypothetical protein
MPSRREHRFNGWKDSKPGGELVHPLPHGPSGAPLRSPDLTTEEDREGAVVAAESSFDVVSKVDRQEVDNALNQAAKEILQRYDFKGTDASITWSGETILMRASSEDRVKAVLDVFQTKLIKRQVSLKAIDAGDPKPSGKEYRIEAALKEGLTQENAKKITKLIRDEGPKTVKAQITGDELRVSSKSRDDLQVVISLLKGADLDVALQFINYR